MMTEQKTGTRKQEHEIEIDAPIDLVWKAITEPDQIIRWLCEEASVTPSKGGHFWVSWGEGQAGDSVIEAWEPGKQLRIRLLGQGGQGDETAKQSPQYNEYLLESRGNKTVLRLIHSGISAAPDWDGYYDGLDRGWQIFLLALRHYLENHAGVARDNIVVMRPLATELSEAWRKLTGPEGLGLPEPLTGPESLAEANSAQTLPTYKAKSAQGDSFGGSVCLLMPPKTLLITIESLNNAMLTATFEEMGGTTFFYMSLATFGLGAEKSGEVRERWANWMDNLLPSAS